MNLPEKLRNLGIKPAPTEKVKVILSDRKVQTLADVIIDPSKISRELLEKAYREIQSKKQTMDAKSTNKEAHHERVSTTTIRIPRC